MRFVLWNISLLRKWLWKHGELLFWITALILLYFLPENTKDTSLCLFSYIGFGHCPGCGIGHAIHYALHLNFPVSFRYHPFGITGVIIIFMRIKQLCYFINLTHEA